MIGRICVASREPRDFTASETDLLTGLATQAAVAIENARLYEEVRGLARDRRAGHHDAERRLAARIESLDTPQASCVARAFSIFFDLANIAAYAKRATGEKFLITPQK